MHFFASADDLTNFENTEPSLPAATVLHVIGQLNPGAMSSKLTVVGLARNIDQLSIVLGDIEHGLDVGTSGQWSAEIEGVPAETSAVSIKLADGSLVQSIELAKGEATQTILNECPVPIRFGAGDVSRDLTLRSYVPLSLWSALITTGSNLGYSLADGRVGSGPRLFSLEREALKELAEYAGGGTEDSVSALQNRRRLVFENHTKEDASARRGSAARREPNGSRRRELIAVTTRPSNIGALWASAAAANPKPGADGGVLPGRDPDLITDPDAPPPEPVWFDLLDKFSFIGILFADKLRYRPLGPVVGEMIQHLSLMPGEVVEYSQASETKLSRSIEDITEREIESNLTLSSVWTTEVSLTEAAEIADKIGANVGLGLKSSEAPVSGNIGLNYDSTWKASEQRQAKLSLELTRQIGTRLREQHRTVLNVKDDTTLGSRSQRRLVNERTDRSKHIAFHKIYRKELVSLEREDAQMCAILHVAGPYQPTIDRLIAYLHAAAPDEIPPGAVAQADDPPTEGATTTTVYDIPQSQLTVQIVDPDIYAYVNEIDAKADDDGLVLISAEVEVTEWEVENFSIQNGTTTTQMPEQAFPVSGYTELRHKTDSGVQDLKTAYGEANPTLELRVFHPTYGFFPFQSVTTKTDVRVTCTWGAPKSETAVQDSVADVVASRFEQLDREELAADIRGMLTLAQSDIVQQLTLQQFAGYPDGAAQALHDYFEVANLTADFVPWWTDQAAHAQRADIINRLNRFGLNSLTAELPDQMFSTSARIVLPIRPGAEDDALAIFGNPFEVLDLARLGSDFRKWREERFGLAREATSASARGPVFPMQTALGATEWANAFETPLFKSHVLAEWTETTPTDGVYAATSLGKERIGPQDSSLDSTSNDDET